MLHKSSLTAAEMLVPLYMVVRGGAKTLCKWDSRCKLLQVALFTTIGCFWKLLLTIQLLLTADQRADKTKSSEFDVEH